jgi:leader peptidase (prepilin peptidase)/N-methyltransferase
MLIEISVTILYGWLLGSLVNYFADILPLYRRVQAPVCIHCQARRKWWTILIPRGCPDCGKSKVLRAWLVILFFVLSSIWLRENYPSRLGYYLSSLLLAYLALVTVIDIEHRVILHEVSIAGALIGLVLGSWLHGLPLTLLGGAAGFGAMYMLFALGAFYVRRRSAVSNQLPEEDALGFGDVNLSGVIGLLLGWPGVIAGLFLGVLLGGAVSLVVLVMMLARQRYRLDASIPYGPFLAASAAILLIFRTAML